MLGRWEAPGARFCAPTSVVAEPNRRKPSATAAARPCERIHATSAAQCSPSPEAPGRACGRRDSTGLGSSSPRRPGRGGRTARCRWSPSARAGGWRRREPRERPGRHGGRPRPRRGRDLRRVPSGAVRRRGRDRPHLRARLRGRGAHGHRPRRDWHDRPVVLRRRAHAGHGRPVGGRHPLALAAGPAARPCDRRALQPVDPGARARRARGIRDRQAADRARVVHEQRGGVALLGRRARDPPRRWGAREHPPVGYPHPDDGQQGRPELVRGGRDLGRSARRPAHGGRTRVAGRRRTLRGAPRARPRRRPAGARRRRARPRPGGAGRGADQLGVHPGRGRLPGRDPGPDGGDLRSRDRDRRRARAGGPEGGGRRGSAPRRRGRYPPHPRRRLLDLPHLVHCGQPRREPPQAAPARPDRPCRGRDGGRRRRHLAGGARGVRRRPGLRSRARLRRLSRLPCDPRPHQVVRGHQAHASQGTAHGMGDPTRPGGRGGAGERLRGHPGDDAQARLRGSRTARARVRAGLLAAAADPRAGDLRGLGDGADADRRRPLLQPPLPHLRPRDLRAETALRVRDPLRGDRGRRRAQHRAPERGRMGCARPSSRAFATRLHSASVPRPWCSPSRRPRPASRPTSGPASM